MTTSVHIEFKRIQTWLFRAPYLRPMIGSNVLLGETLSRELPRRVNDGVDLTHLSPSEPPECATDPIRGLDRFDRLVSNGIVASNGGHFEAVFKDDASRDAFLAAATVPLGGLEELGTVTRVDGQEVETMWARDAIPPLPIFQICQVTGRGVALADPVDGKYVSADVQARLRAADRYVAGGASDWASLLQAELKHEGRAPRDFEALCGNEYMAVVHVDGNGIGARATAYSGVENSLENLVKRGWYFARLRSNLRAAIAHAEEEAFCSNDKDRELSPRPYQILMLGGDDLLLVCRARFALRFVKHLAARLAELPAEPGRPPFTFAAGVAIARPSVPFHLLHDRAEQLLSSAKRFSRGLGDVSTVDWACWSGSYPDDPITQRRRTALHRVGDETLVCSVRPVRVSELGSMLDVADQLDASVRATKGARTQLRRLRSALGAGRQRAELAWLELARPTRDALVAAGVKHVWDETSTPGTYRTPIADLVELFEIPRLGRATDHSPDAAEAIDA